MQIQPRPTAARPSGQQQAQTRLAHQPPVNQPVRTTQPKKPFVKKTIFIAIVALILFGALLAWQLLSSQIQSDRYQAVFLSNGQVYFGRLHGYYGSKPFMTDVHYFQANSQTVTKDSISSNQLLVKLGDEVHAPEGKLILNKDAILFVENLSEKSKVTEAIKKEAAGTDASASATGGITR
jgi:hypothetical protein